MLLSIAGLVLLILWMQEHCRDLAKINRLFATEETIEKVRAQKVSPDLLAQFRQWGQEEELLSWEDYLCLYLMSGAEEKHTLQRYRKQFRDSRPEEYQTLKGYLTAVWEDLVYFPVPRSVVHDQMDVSYVDSWMYERTFGGKRGHEGTDLMASVNERGRYPIVSMTDGVVEQIGWLTKGGYRLGIRSPHGGYFYYAHLYDYARDFQPGDTVRAGEWIGFMGDSGYSKIEGTVGNFDVHLHLGIYVNRPDGSEMSINPFAVLQSLEERKLKYVFY